MSFHQFDFTVREQPITPSALLPVRQLAYSHDYRGTSKFAKDYHIVRIKGSTLLQRAGSGSSPSRTGLALRQKVGKLVGVFDVGTEPGCCDLSASKNCAAVANRPDIGQLVAN